MTRQELLEVCQREEFIPLDLIARTLQMKRRTLLKSWRRDNVPFVREGNSVRIRSDLVLARYYRDKAHDRPESTTLT